MVRRPIKIMVMFSMLSLFLPCQAQTTAPELGRLFSNTAERQSLNKMRKENQVQTDVAAPVPEHAGVQASAPDNRPKAIVINGLVQRGNGDRVVWINGEKVDGANGPDDVRVYSAARDGKIVVGLPGSRAVALKPGQQLQVGNGKVVESYLPEAAKAEATAPE